MTLKEYFDSIDLAKINDFVSDGREEDTKLDFKRVSRSDMKFADDKKNLCKVLSGFANAEGGIAVWGVDARENTDGVDCASDHVSLENVRLFVTRLNEFTGSFVSPTIDGVLHEAIELKGQEPRGYVKTLVPEVDTGPHMAKWKEYRYYKRAGDRFQKMEHFEVADMFGRRPRPDLDLLVKPGEKHDYPTPSHMFVSVLVENSGRGCSAGDICSSKGRETLPNPLRRLPGGSEQPAKAG